MPDNSAKIFSDNWNVYQKIIQLNYMYHAEFTQVVTSIFDDMRQRSINVLDIGCGDAGFLKPVLQTLSINAYTGYDLSAPALQIASGNLNKSTFTIELKQGDMLVLIEQETKLFDIIHAGFAVHHLQEEDKTKMYKACFKRLKPGGRMIYTDIFRKTGVDRNGYLSQYFSMMKSKWIALTVAEYELIYNHVSQFDFPSILETTIDQLRQTGFTLINKLETDDFHSMLVLEKR